MRLGGPIMGEWRGPEAWIAALQQRGYTAAMWPLALDADEAAVNAVVQAARDADIVIAEVGAWHNNPVSNDTAVRERSIANIQAWLALADRVGARCCVNVAGSRGDRWDGPCAEDLSEAAFDLIVQSVQGIIDAVQPTHTFFTLETMPWMLPNSTDSYLQLLNAVDRPGFAVHFDPVNLVNSPQAFFFNADLIRDFCDRLGPYIRSVHAKDVTLATELTVHLDEVPPGDGSLAYDVLLTELEAIDPDMPVLMEHFQYEDAYTRGAAYIRQMAGQAGVTVK